MGRSGDHYHGWDGLGGFEAGRKARCCNHHQADLEGAAGGKPGTFGGAGAEAHFPPDLSLEPVHLVIDLKIDVPGETARGKVVTTVQANRAGARSLVLDAIDFLDLKVSAVGTLGGAVTSSYDGAKIALTWEKPFARGERRDVEVAYRVTKPASGLFFMSPSPEYPHKGTYAATDHETERARYWLPCVDLPAVRTTLEFRLTAAAEYTILANGASQGETTNSDGTKTARWRLEQRCPSYLVCFAIGDFVRWDGEAVDGMPVAAFACKDFTAQDLERSFGRTPAMLKWMQKRLGVKFPYPKYYQFALPGFSGAMENISLVSWNDYFVVPKAIEHERTWLTDQVNAHEMAHSYFGDLVGCREFAHAWLKESWATYMEACWLEDSKGADEQLFDLYRCAQGYFRESDERYARPVVTRKYSSSWQMYDAHLYPGGACRLHTLRKELGDDCFWAAVSDYLTTHRDTAVETDDFRKMLEKHSGRSLVKLFEQWFFTAAYPKLKVTFAYDKEKATGTFDVEQKQVDEKKGIPPFELSTELGWTIDGKDQVLAIKLDQAKQSFTIRMDKEPEQVRFDPNWKALHKLEFDPGEAKLKAQLTGAKDVVGRVLAAWTLCEKGKRSGVLAVVDAYKKEPFWGVREEMLKALADSQTEEGLAGILGAIESEKNHMVLSAVFHAAGAYRDARVAPAVRARLDKGDVPPYATGAAYWALGKQRDPSLLPVLEAAAAKSDRQLGAPQAQALMATAMTRAEGSVKFLLDRTAYGKVPYRARYGVVSGLGVIAPYVDKPLRVGVEERLVDLLRDKEPWIRHGAAAAIGQARVKSAAGALEAYRSRVSLQEAVGVDSIIKGLAGDEDPKTVGLEKQLDEMKEKFRKLHDRVQTLEDRSK